MSYFKGLALSILVLAPTFAQAKASHQFECFQAVAGLDAQVSEASGRSKMNQVYPFEHNPDSRKKNSGIEYGYMLPAGEGARGTFAAVKAVWHDPRMHVGLCLEDESGSTITDLSGIELGKVNHLNISTHGVDSNFNANLDCRYVDNVAFVSERERTVPAEHRSTKTIREAVATVNGVGGEAYGIRGLVCDKKSFGAFEAPVKTVTSDLQKSGGSTRMCKNNFHTAIANRFWKFAQRVSPYETVENWPTASHNEKKDILEKVTQLKAACKSSFPKEVRDIVMWSDRHLASAKTTVPAGPAAHGTAHSAH